ncbi:MAG: hypothetical protein AAF653_12920, partial [Chloroflexota bacterium]
MCRLSLIMNGKRTPLSELDAPYISVGGVRAALNGLVHGDPEKVYNSTLALCMVDAYLMEHQLPDSDRTRFFALSDLLVEVIRSSYTTLRQELTAKDPHIPLTCDDLLLLLAEDVEMTSSALLEWGVLLVLYVYSDYGLSMDDVADVFSTTERNIRRYRNRGLSRLTDAVIELERRAIEQIRQVRLIASLPVFQSSLIGRSDEINTIERCYRQQWGCFIVVAGRSGTGKSHLVATSLRRIIEHEPPRHLFWFRSAQNVEHVLTHIHDRTLYHLQSVTLQEFTAVHRVTIVLDNNVIEPEDLHALHEQIPAMDLIVTVNNLNESTSIGRPDCLIRLKPLSADDSHRLADQTMHNDGMIGQGNSPVFTLTTGIPGQIKRQVRDIHANLSLADVLLAGCTLHPDNGLSLSEPIVQNMTLVDAQHIHQQTFISDAALRIRELDAITLRKAWHDGQRLDLLQQQALIVAKQQVTHYTPRTMLDIAETLLQVFTEAINHDQRAEIILSRWRDVAAHRRLQTWLQLVESQIDATETTDNTKLIQLLIVKANLLERTAFRPQAAAIFIDVIQLAGEQGAFAAQQEAMLGLAMHYRRSGLYTQAFSILSRITDNIYAEDLSYRVQLENLKLLLQTRQYEAFADAVAFAEQSAEVMSLKCQYMYLKQQFEDGLQAAHDVLSMSQPAMSGLPLAYNTAMVARGHLGLQAYETAEDLFLR